MHHELAPRNSGLIIALMACSRSFSRSAIRAAQLSGGSAAASAAVSASSVEEGHTSSNASAISRENSATSFCSSRAAALCEGVNRSRCGTSVAVSSNSTEPWHLISTLSTLPFGGEKEKIRTRTLCSTESACKLYERFEQVLLFVNSALAPRAHFAFHLAL